MRHSRVITYRVSEEHHALLSSRAEQGGSPGSVARELMLRALHEETLLGGVQQRLDRQDQQVADLRKDLRVVLRSALVFFAKLNPDQAKEWVSQALK